MYNQDFHVISSGMYRSKLIHRKDETSIERKTSVFEIDIPIENGGISYVDTFEAKIKPGLIIFVKPDQIRHTKFPYKCFYIHFEILNNDIVKLLSDVDCFFHTDRYDLYIDLINKINIYRKSEEDKYDLLLYSTIYELLYMLISDYKQFAIEKKLPSHYFMVEKVTKYINDNLSETLDTSTIASNFNFSRTYFHKIFRSVTGKTLHEYIEEKRIQKATKLLLTDDYTVTQIASECGFSSQSYFSYAFKRKMNITPKEYAKRMSINYEQIN